MPNSSGKQTPVTCSSCLKVYSSARNLRRHEQTIRKIFANPPPPTICDKCRESLAILAEAREHVELSHNVKYIARRQCCFWTLKWSMSSTMESTRRSIWKLLSTWSKPSILFFHTAANGLWSAPILSGYGQLEVDSNTLFVKFIREKKFNF